ncbi:hypothetical protein [Amycolatopsis sp. NPDC054798]
MSLETIITRVAEMSATSIWALTALFGVVIVGTLLLMVVSQKSRRRVRVKLPFIEFESEPASEELPTVDDKVPPPSTLDLPQLLDTSDAPPGGP